MKTRRPCAQRHVRLSVALLLGALGGAGWVAAQTQDRIPVGPVIEFQPGTAKAKAFFQQHLVTRDLVSESFEMAGVDLDGDGRKEVVLRSTAASYCSGRAGCAVQVLQRRGQQVVELLNLYTSERLAVTRDPVGGIYRALAVVDDQGQVVRADRPGTPMHGKPMVYPMGRGR